ncbi:hypothetical protein [Saccharothrix lopnurensis]|uniref:Uncharacterized protein n=1 Tax=Saccharothrix lopnurensis TaxID=1670621 RepID=A0ABW1PIT1_9PSEU
MLADDDHDVDAVPARAEIRDGRVFTDERRGLPRRTAPLFEHLTALEPVRVRLLDRHDPDALVEIIGDRRRRRTHEHLPQVVSAAALP